MRPPPHKPGFGEASLGAVMGAVAGSAGGLFAVGIVPSIVYRDIRHLFGTPMLALMSWVVSIVGGWFIGGQIGPRLRSRFRSRRAETIGGCLGGLIPVAAIIAWSWYITMRG